MGRPCRPGRGRARDRRALPRPRHPRRGGPGATWPTVTLHVARRSARRHLQLRPRHPVRLHVGGRPRCRRAGRWRHLRAVPRRAVHSRARRRGLARRRAARRSRPPTVAARRAWCAPASSPRTPAAIDGFGRRMVALATRCRGVRCIGSPALCLAYVAAGRIDGFLERDATYAWDVGARRADDRRGGGPHRGSRRRPGQPRPGPGQRAGDERADPRRAGRAWYGRPMRRSAHRRGQVMTVSGKRIVVTGGARGDRRRAGGRAAWRAAPSWSPPTSRAGADVVLRRERRRPGRRRSSRQVGRGRRPGELTPPCSSTAQPYDADRPRRVGPHVRGQRAGLVPVRAGGGRAMGETAAAASSTSPRRRPSPGSHGFVHYVASKGAVISMTRALANELGRRGHPGELRGAGVHADAGLGGARAVRPEPHAARSGHAARRPARARSATCCPTTRRSCRARRSSSTAAGCRTDRRRPCSTTTTPTGLAALVRPRRGAAASSWSSRPSSGSRPSTRSINAVIHRQFERARRDAGGPLPDGPFRGVPFLLKDFAGQEAGEPHHQGMRALRDAGWRRRRTARSPGASGPPGSSRSAGPTCPSWR